MGYLRYANQNIWQAEAGKAVFLPYPVWGGRGIQTKDMGQWLVRMIGEGKKLATPCQLACNGCWWCQQGWGRVRLGEQAGLVIADKVSAKMLYAVPDKAGFATTRCAQNEQPGKMGMMQGGSVKWHEAAA